MEADEEHPLVGGHQTPGIVRVGETVRRPTGPHSPFVHDLLRHLAAVGFTGAPRVLGIDAQGREILTFIAGEVAHEHHRYVPIDARLASAAELIRTFHAATAGCPLAAGSEIVSHNDLGPHNTVVVGDRAVALLDWDTAAPGTRLFDLAIAIWAYANVGAGGGRITLQARRIGVMCEAYGWEDRGAIVDEIHADLRRARANHAQAGRANAVRIFDRMVGWMETHSAELKRRL